MRSYLRNLIEKISAALLLLMILLCFFNSSRITKRPVLTSEIYVEGHDTIHRELCPLLGANLQLIILVSSETSHIAERIAIRDTWGRYRSQSIPVIFFLGKVPEHIKKLIEVEDALYGDIIIGRFEDSYANLTLKTLSLLEWVDKYCNLVPNIVKTDDDIFINVPKLMNFSQDPAIVNASKTIWGKINRRVKPDRNTYSKYEVPIEQYPGNRFPDFVRGAVYLMTTDMIRDMLVIAPNELYVRLEDVFVTGILASKLDVERVNVEEFCAHDVEDLRMSKEKIGSLLFDISEQFYCWKIFNASSKLKFDVVLMLIVIAICGFRIVSTVY